MTTSIPDWLAAPTVALRVDGPASLLDMRPGRLVHLDPHESIVILPPDRHAFDYVAGMISEDA